MQLNGTKILLGCAILNAAIVLYHIWFLFFGMGENYNPGLPSMTAAVAAIFLVFTAYALSGAGIIRRLPLLKTGLAIPATIYTLYGLALLLQRTTGGYDSGEIIARVVLGTGVLALGVAHFIGMRTAAGRV